MSVDRIDRDALRRLLLVAVGVDLEADAPALESAARGMTPTAWSVLPQAADNHGITQQVVRSLALVSDVVPDETARELRQRSLAHHAATVRGYGALLNLMPILDTNTDAWALLKGPVLADYVYRFPGRRSYSDLDVLVRPHHLRPVLEGLERAGAMLITRNWRYLRERGKAELVLLLPNGTPLDLHWGLLGSPAKFPGLQMPAARLLERVQPVVLGGPETVTVPSLEASDLLIHIAVHAVLSGFGALRSCLDVDQASRLATVNNVELLERLAETRAGLPLAVGLSRAASALGANQRTAALLGLARSRDGRGWRSVMAAVDRFNPPVRAHEPMPMQFLTRSTRESTRQSAFEVGRFIHDRLPVLSSPAEFRRRLRTGLGVVVMDDIETLDVDGGEREQLLCELERS